MYLFTCFCVCKGAYVPQQLVEVKGQFVEIGSLLPSCRSPGSNSGCQAWQPVTLPGKPCLWPSACWMSKYIYYMNMTSITQEEEKEEMWGAAGDVGCSRLGAVLPEAGIGLYSSFNLSLRHLVTNSSYFPAKIGPPLKGSTAKWYTVSTSWPCALNTTKPP